MITIIKRAAIALTILAAVMFTGCSTVGSPTFSALYSEGDKHKSSPHRPGFDRPEIKPIHNQESEHFERVVDGYEIERDG
jgi:hypothetical protein